MANKNSVQLAAYLTKIGYRLDPIQQALVAQTQAMTGGTMQIPPEQASFMQFFVKLIGAKKCIEFGTFTGLSTLCTAMGIPQTGKVYALDMSEEWTNIGRKYWEQAGVQDKIELIIGPAVDSAQSLIDQGHSSSFDFAFIDADKQNYDRYYDQSLQLLRVGGVLFVDNALWYGKAANLEVNDADTLAIRDLNERMHEDPRIDQMMLTMADGIHMAIKR